MTLGGAYVRVYYSIQDEPKFESIYEDDHHLSAWLRLLIVADQIWPASPPIPARIRMPSFKALVSAGLVDLMPRHCYRIHGLDNERMKRSDSARNAAAVRWQSDSNAPASNEQSDSNASRAGAETETETETEAKTKVDRPPSEMQVVKAWLRANDFGDPSGWAHKPFAEMCRTLTAPVVIGHFEEAKAGGVRLSNELVRWVERSVAPSTNGHKPGRFLEHDPKELSDAFVRD